MSWNGTCGHVHRSIRDTSPWALLPSLGDGAQQFAVGQRCISTITCHVCSATFRQRGSFSQCATFRATRLYPGGLAEYIRVPAPNVERDVLPLPDDISFEAATLIEPLACCIRGIDRAAIQAGSCLCVLGAGSNGVMLAQLAQQRGASCVIIVDPITYRRQRTLEIGIDFALDPSTKPVLEQIHAINNGRKPDIVIVTPSKVSAMQQGMELVGPGGTLLLFAPPAPDEILPTLPNSLFFQEITLRTSYSAGPYETRLALELLRHKTHSL